MEAQKLSLTLFAMLALGLFALAFEWFRDRGRHWLLLIGVALAALMFALFVHLKPAGAHDHHRPELKTWFETCTASQYGVGDGYHGKRTASGAIFNTHALTAAHRSRPFGSVVTVTNLRNGQSVRVTITDRGPFVKGRCIDLSRAGANAIGMGGLARVSVH